MPNAELAMPHVDPILPLIVRLVHSANLALEWLLTYAIHSTILIGGLLLIASTPGGRKVIAGFGTWFWRFALVGGLVTASLQSLRSTSPVAGTLRLDRDTPAETVVRVEVNARHSAITSGNSLAVTRN